MAEDVVPYLLNHRPNLLLMLKRFQPEHYIHAQQMTSQQLVASVLAERRVQRLIRAVAAKENEPVEVIKERAVAVLLDISHQLNLKVARVVCYLVTRLGSHLFETITLNLGGIEKWKSIMGSTPLVVLPTHRSYIDFLLVSPICFAHDIPIPVVVAGQDFKSMAVIGRVLRNCGAFYMQRSFSKNVFYKTIFSQYVRAIMEDGTNPMEFFIEGTRSRTGKALHPKMGIISYVFEQFFQGMVGDFALCPMSITYERPLEEDSHVLSMLGIGKPPESSVSMIRGIHNVLRKRNGHVRISFADPLRVHELCSKRVNRLLNCQLPRIENFDEQLADPVAGRVRAEEASPLDPRIVEEMRAERKVVKDMAYKIVGVQQQHLVVYPRFIIATIFLQMVGKQISLADLTREVLWLKRCLLALGAPEVILDDSNAESEVRRAVSLLHPPLFMDEEKQVVRVLEDVSFATRPGIDLVELCDNARDYPTVFTRAAVELQLVYPHHQLVHLISDVGMLSVLLNIRPKNCPIGEAQRDFAIIAGVLREEFVFDVADADPTEIFQRALEKLQKCEAVVTNDNKNISVTEDGLKLVQFLAKTIHPLLVTVWVFGNSVLGLSANQPDAFFLHKWNLSHTQIEACKLLAQGQITHYRCVGVEMLKSALQSLVHSGLLKRDAESDNICVASGQRPTLIRVMDMLGGILCHAGQRLAGSQGSHLPSRL